MTKGLEREELAVKEGWELKMQIQYAGVMSWLNNYMILLNSLNHLLYVTLKKKADKYNGANGAAHFPSVHEEPNHGFGKYHF